MNRYAIKPAGWPQHYKVFLALLLSLTLFGCHSNDDDDHGMMNSNLVAIQISASAKQEVPTNTSTATASGSLSLDSQTGALSGTLTTTGMTATAAHIHEAKAGANGPVVIALDVDGEKLSVPAGTMLSSAQIAAMLAGEYYVNIHSAAQPGGEIRAQVTPSNVAVVVLALSGANEVPAVTTSGTGTAYVTLNRTSSMLSINVSTTTDTAAAAAHLHGGFAGENGGVLVPLVQDSSDSSKFTFSGMAEQSVIDAIDAGGAYLNIHTAAVGSGELRAQVLLSGVTTHAATLSGAQEVPPVTSSGSGSGALTLNTNTNKATVVLRTSDVAGATMAHVHSGAAGANGDVIFGLTEDTANAGQWVARDVTVDAAAIASIKAGNTYFNVHTTANPSGEIRGQIDGINSFGFQ